MPTSDRVKEYITWDISNQLLSQYIEAADQPRLLDNSKIRSQLVCFVQAAFAAICKALLAGDSTGKLIESFDNITVDLVIPSKHKVASKLPVRKLLDCKRHVTSR